MHGPPRPGVSPPLASGSNLPPGGDHLVAQHLSPPECPRLTSEGQMTQPQSRALPSGPGCADAKCTDGHPYDPEGCLQGTNCDWHRKLSGRPFHLVTQLKVTPSLLR